MRAIDKELQDYVTILDEKQKEAALEVLKAMAGDTVKESDWEDENFVAAVDKQSQRYRSSASASYPGDQRTKEPRSGN